QELANGAVEVPGIVRQLLVIVLQLAAIDIEADHRACVEIVARARALRLVIAARPIVERRRIGSAPQDCIVVRVVGAGHPATTTPGTPGVIAPRLHGVIGAGDGQELPFLLARCGINTEDRATTRPLATLCAD